jgi:hypothetical protein
MIGVAIIVTKTLLVLAFRFFGARAARANVRRVDTQRNFWHFARCGIPDCSMPAFEALRSNSGLISAREEIPAVEIVSEMRQGAETVCNF